MIRESIDNGIEARLEEYCDLLIRRGRKESTARGVRNAVRRCAGWLEAHGFRTIEEVDAEAVATVKRTNAVSDTEGVKITAELTYEGKTYSDGLTVYITRLDKATAGVRFWKESFTVAVGETAALPADIRVPINESAEDKKEEEYELTVEVSDPEALSVEIDGKDLFATALKPVAGPVTVSVTMKCGGHTYGAQIPVNVKEGTEAADNG